MQQVDLQYLLQQIRSLCRSLNPAEERAIRETVTATEFVSRGDLYIYPEQSTCRGMEHSEEWWIVLVSGVARTLSSHKFEQLAGPVGIT